MNKANYVSRKGLVYSFKVAFRGLRVMLRSQRHAWIHLTATLAVCIAGASLGITPIEWCWLIIVITSVWMAETLNTAFEFLCDVASPEFHPLVEKAKDVAAGAVLICAVGAAIIGIVIFLPYF